MKRLLLEEGRRDFPAFVPHLFRKVPSGDAHYHLWDGATPETLDPKAVERAWERELERWGGERAFAEHWSRYRQFRHEFVRCDVLGSAARLLARVEPEEHAVIWWSNAFFSVWGNWLLDAAERKSRLRAVGRGARGAESGSLPVRVRLLEQQRERRPGRRVPAHAPGRRLRRARPAVGQHARDPLLVERL